MRDQLYLSIILTLLTTSLVKSQSGAPHPEFAPFTGIVYKMGKTKSKTPRGTEITTLLERYGPHIEDYEKIKEITLDEVNVPETECSKGLFPGITQQTKFAMVLHSEVNIKADACYEFSLNSDDGSILWINDEIVVNNDGGHPMEMKKDSLALPKGKHKVKLWYFQSYPNKYGLQLDGKIIGKVNVCPNPIHTQPINEKFALSSKTLFMTGMAKLQTGAKESLAQLFKGIDLETITAIKVVGHTDSTGDRVTNQQLSMARAKQVKLTLLAITGLDEALIQSEGRGQSEPISTNETAEGRSENRRVEIVVSF